MSTVLPHDHGHDDEFVIRKLPSPDKVAEGAAMFAMLDDPSRMKIFWVLCHTEECVSNIAAIVDMSASSVSHHLKLLQANKLITNRRLGKEIHYVIADNENAALCHRILDDFFHCYD